MHFITKNMNGRSAAAKVVLKTSHFTRLKNFAMPEPVLASNTMQFLNGTLLFCLIFNRNSLKEFRWDSITRQVGFVKKRDQAGRHFPTRRRRCPSPAWVTKNMSCALCENGVCWTCHTAKCKRNGSDKKFSKHALLPKIQLGPILASQELHNMINDHLVKTKHDSINNIYIHWWVQASLTVAIHLIAESRALKSSLAKTSLFPLTTITTAAAVRSS